MRIIYFILLVPVLVFSSQEKEAEYFLTRLSSPLSPEERALSEQYNKLKEQIRLLPVYGELRSDPDKQMLEIEEKLWGNSSHFQKKVGGLVPPTGLGRTAQKELILRKPIPADFSGALEWAHKQGVYGQTQKILLIEETGSRHSYSKYIPSLKLYGVPNYYYGIACNHSHAVAGVLQNMAPQAKILVVSESISSAFVRKFHPGFQDNTILNISMESLIGAETGWIDGFLKSKNNLLVKSAGNDGLDLEKKGIHDNFTLLTQDNSAYKKQIILAGAIKSNNDILEMSNRPGHNSIYQERFLMALGAEVPANTGHGLRFLNGTSLSAPTISGAAALLRSAYEDLSMEEIGDIPLNSADRSFFIHRDGETIFIYEKALPKYLVPSVQYKPFDPFQYGRGILNLRNAFLYGAFYDAFKKKNKGMRYNELLDLVDQEFKKMKEKIDDQKARLIQNAYRQRTHRSIKGGMGGSSNETTKL